MPARTELLEYVAIRDANPSPNRVQSVVEWHTPTLDVLSNESRLSCAALVKNQIPLRAAAASAACYAGAQPISNPLSSPLRRLRSGCCRILQSAGAQCPGPYDAPTFRYPSRPAAQAVADPRAR